jgi:hypothetical protein
MRFASWTLLLLVVMVGCAAGPVHQKKECNVRNVTANLEQEWVAGEEGIERVNRLGKNDSLIFGRIVLIRNGESQIPYGFNSPWWSLQSPPGVGPEKVQCYRHFLGTRRDGTFVWIVPAGRYELTLVSPPGVEPALELDVSESGIAYYLGDLLIDYDKLSWYEHMFLSSSRWPEHFNYLEVVDRYDEVRGRVLPLLHQLEEVPPVRKGLMTRIPGKVPHELESLK